MFDCDKPGVFGGACATLGCDNTAMWIPISEGNEGGRLYRCQGCCDRIAEGRFMTDAQREKLIWLCERYGVEFAESDYQVIPQDSGWQRGWAQGWVGGEPGTIYVGVDPKGASHS